MFRLNNRISVKIGSEVPRKGKLPINLRLYSAKLHFFEEKKVGNLEIALE